MGSSIDFKQFHRLSEDFAAFLIHDLGLKPGDRFAIMLPNVLQFPIAFFAAQRAGLVCVNTNPLYTPREMNHQFKDSGAKAIIILDLFADKLEEILKDTDIEQVILTGIGDQLPAFKSFVIHWALKLKGQLPKHSLEFTSFNQALKRGQSHNLRAPTPTLDDVAILQYTGGTTGVSKGAELTHRNIMANVDQMQTALGNNLTEGDATALTALPLYHIFALSVNFLWCARSGFHSILVPKPVPIVNTIKIFEAYKPTLMTGVNTLFNALNNHPRFQKHSPHYIKLAIAGGMALQEGVARDFQKLTGTRITQGFGLTEASPVTHVCPLEHAGPIGSIGHPLPATEAKVVDTEGKEVADEEVGELVIRGPQVMKGYWQRPDETKKTIKDGWLYTGDMAKKDKQGWYYIVDRKKDLIIVSGFNVFPGEIEETLCLHPKVLEAAVVGLPDEKSGEAVKAFIVAKDSSVTTHELEQYCKTQLTNYKRPKHWEFRDELPKTNVGKILRKDLREKAAVKE